MEKNNTRKRNKECQVQFQMEPTVTFEQISEESKEVRFGYHKRWNFK